MTFFATRLTPFRTIFGVDLRTLALFRILLAIWVLIDLAMRARDLVAHYTDFGVMPRSVQLEHLYTTTWSLHLANGSAWFQATLFVVAGLAALGLLVGWRTRLMTILSWALLLSLQNRNTFILSGEDNLALLLLFWAMFLPLGARYSLDAALSRHPHQTGNDYFSVATLALLLQGMSMYFFSALLKTHPIWVADGTAVYFALQLDYLVTPFALWFRQFHGLMTGLTYYVYVLELVGPILIFSPIFHRTLRTVFMLAFMTMHMAFAVFLEIGFFPFISIIMNLTFMPGWMWDKLASWLPFRSREPVQLWFDQGCDFCEKTCRILTTFLFMRKIPVAPAQTVPDIGAELEARNSWVLTIGEERFFKFQALARLITVSPVFYPLGWMLNRSLFLKPGYVFYDWVGRNRSFFSRFTATCLPWRETQPRFGTFTQIGAALCLVFITIQNVSTLSWSGVSLPGQFVGVRQALGLYQNWTMFAPYPEMNSPWPVIEGELTDGTIADVYKGRAGLADFEKPDVVSQTFANYRWRKFLSNLEDQSYENVPQVLSLNYARFLCRNWTGEHPDEASLANFVIFFQVENTPPPGSPKEVQTRQVWSHSCFG
ncbi:HTTM domain-containing protein [Roseibium sp. MMSF_3544]|uniref:HTTM domain-containing protein n=1 Tax=unclassified Roseibium TaxID=2629323 RepID=UPI00273EDE07|nr:HTTM domain-containing protein [Roseibium sp. MMSF_3544]